MPTKAKYGSNSFIEFQILLQSFLIYEDGNKREGYAAKKNLKLLDEECSN